MEINILQSATCRSFTVCSINFIMLVSSLLWLLFKQYSSLLPCRKHWTLTSNNVSMISRFFIQPPSLQSSSTCNETSIYGPDPNLWGLQRRWLYWIYSVCFDLWSGSKPWWWYTCNSGDTSDGKVLVGKNYWVEFAIVLGVVLTVVGIMVVAVIVHNKKENGRSSSAIARLRVMCNTCMYVCM